MGRPPKVELGGWLQWFVHTFSNSVYKKQLGVPLVVQTMW